ncbi:MSHA biogenesis protein MshM [Photobacterium angustum]|uniref:MSHA biogenesis protein MshM n=1 Tax=Photobacterium angustum TaxID=661 RepID=A0A855SA28_PHOAN|nr:AAA family ATPase [Photobacterium angustum]KJF81121.1 MSHA biogenesis protein MshM [Photobacterium damselae subsp. damselae]KJG29535.1 MSHA biogenesis protein MshM [Photobacterium angustum]KJG39269.1 MSHA biogenesis protein MshM [Photobacterium angustum]KJG44633.1 MSHA biogenesis protein MshM [Photobacterium angustum]KJG48304.1 MSHA biogenesis protein MshM [Photobacterium angustum]
MYLEHFGFSQQPFSLTPNTSLFHALPSHIEAIQTVLAALQMGEGITQVSGEVGTGKTLVCRMLMTQLPTHFDLAYLPTPACSGIELKRSLAKELSLLPNSDHALLTEQIQDELISRRLKGQSVVVLLDEAQALSDDALEAIRLLGNLETEQEKLLHIVLLGQPELDQRLAQHQLRQLRQRITFRAVLRPLTLAETVAYIQHRLYQAGYTDMVFNLSICRAIWYASGGTPRLINQLCHKSLLATFCEQQYIVSKKEVLMAIRDTLGAKQPKWSFPILWGWSHS